MNWIDIIDGDFSTYPKEGINVLVSDGTYYDVAYLVISGGLQWLKVSVSEDDAHVFTDIKVSKWCYILDFSNKYKIIDSKLSKIIDYSNPNFPEIGEYIEVNGFKVSKQLFPEEFEKIENVFSCFIDKMSGYFDRIPKNILENSIIFKLIEGKLKK